MDSVFFIINNDLFRGIIVEVNMKKVLSIVLVLMLAFMMVACENDTANNIEDNVAENVVENNEETTNDTEEVIEEEVIFEPVTLTDSEGRSVTIETQPERVISMAPSMTEVVFAIGQGDKLVGRTDYCNYPEAALDVDSIGSLREPNIEAIIALNPDVVLMSTHASEEVLLKLEEASIKVVVLKEQESFDGVYKIIENTGKIFGATEEATAVIDGMKADVEAVMNTVKDAEKQSVYYVVGFGEYGDWTATGDTFIHNLLEMAGGENVAADGEGWSYNLESLIEKDPMYLIGSQATGTKAGMEATEGYMDLTAVKEGRLIEINQDLLSRQGPRLAEGLKVVAKILHPELFE
jgi:iron complex transport system substrate-binding protein